MRLAALACTALVALSLPALAQLKPLQPVSADPVVAKVDGAEIRRSDVALAIEGLPDQYRQMPFEMLFEPVLNRLIDGRLLANAAEKSKLDQDPDAKQRIAAARDRVLQDLYLTREVEKGLGDDKLRAYYDRTVKAATPEDEVRARHILLKTEAEAKAIIAEVAKGADFVEVAKKNSTGPSAANGGDLGFFARGDMVPEFAEAAFGMKPGEVSKAPVQTQFGWHVIKVEERRKAPTPSFEDKKDELRGQLAQEVAQGVLTGLRSGAKVERFDAQGKPAAK